MLGTVQLGLAYGIANNSGQPSRRRAKRILQSALSSGINTFDTARGYGQSETILGELIQGLTPSGHALIISKFTISPANENRLESAFFEAAASLKQSCLELQVRPLPICLFHCSMDNDVHKIAGILPEIIVRLKNEGLLEYAGFSAYFPEDIPTIIGIEEVDLVHFPLSIFDQRVLHRGIVEELKAERKKTIARSVFLQGLFFLESTQVPNHLVPLREPLEKLKLLCQYHEISVARAAVSFVRDVPGVDFLVIGADSGEQVNELVRLMKGPKLSDTLRAEFLNAFGNLEASLLSPGLWDARKVSLRPEDQ